jgi:hypothetical protein
VETQRPELERGVTGRPAGAKGFKPVKWRWLVERTFAWLLGDRRRTRDFEKRTWSSEARVRLAAIRRLLRRATPGPQSQTDKMPKRVYAGSVATRKANKDEALRSG